MLQKIREPMNALTHLGGVIFSFFAWIIILCVGLIKGTPIDLIFTSLIFATSVTLLYGASTLYHWVLGSEKTILWLRKFDHAMIYLLIVGSYTPFVFRFMEGGKAGPFLITIWTIALVGVGIKLVWMSCPRWISTGIYLILGWSVLFDLSSFNIPGNCMFYLLGGGISYTIGAVFYTMKRPKHRPYFNYHEIFHLFVLMGTFFHFLAIIFTVL